MRLVDTSAWIEWFTDGPLQTRIGSLLPKQSDWLVPTIVQYELSKWLLRNSLVNERGQEVIAFSTRCVVKPLTTEIAVAASHFGRTHKLAVVDALIYASAQAYDADLVTCDAHFEGLPSVHYLAKKPN
jgi:predicted nucleic acid-binding protein